MSSSMPRIVVFAALPWECSAACRWLGQVQRGRQDEHPWWQGHAGEVVVRVVRTGIGPTRAETVASAALEEFPCDLVINTGCAGGLDPGLSIGSAVIADTVICARSGERYAAHSGAIEAFSAAAHKAGVPSHIGPQLCVPQALADTAEKQAAHRRYGALAVDMESAAVVRAASRRQIPFASIRSILDPASASVLVPGTVLDGTRGQVRLLPLMRWLAVRGVPGWRQLGALGSAKRQAEASLSVLFSRYFESLRGIAAAAFLAPAAK